MTAVIIDTDPVEESPSPLIIEITPPSFSSDEPDRSNKSPPFSNSLLPTSITMSPDVPVDTSVDPVANTIDPLLPSTAEDPVETNRLPVLPFETSSDVMVTSPDIINPVPLFAIICPPSPLVEEPASNNVSPPDDAPAEDPALIETVPPDPYTDELSNADPAEISMFPAYAPSLLSPECTTIAPPSPLEDVPTSSDIPPDPSK